MKVEFIPLLNLSEDGAVSSILKLDDAIFLLDCGINENLDLSIYKKYKSMLENVNFILLSHSDIQFAGALPFLFLHMGCKANVYATLPVTSLSLINLFDFLMNRLPSWEVDFYKETYKNFYKVYENIVEVKFHQKFHIDNDKFTVTPDPIGHSVGSCSWKISTRLNNIIYFVSYNHANEKHIKGLSLESFDLDKIDLIITNSNNISKKYIDMDQIDKQFFDLLLQSLSQKGTAIIVCSNLSRIYETLIKLREFWHDYYTKNPLAKHEEKFSVSIFHNFSALLELAQNQLEFMSYSLTGTVLSTGENPFRIFNDPRRNPHTNISEKDDITLCKGIEDMGQAPNGRVVITDMANIFFGPAKEILQKHSRNNTDLIVFFGSKGYYGNKLSRIMHQGDPFYRGDDYLNMEIFQALENQYRLNMKKEELMTEEIGNADQETMITDENEFNEIPKDTHSFTSNAQLFCPKYFPMYAQNEQKIMVNEYGEILRDNELDVFRKHYAKYTSLLKEYTITNMKGNLNANKTNYQSFFFKNDLMLHKSADPIERMISDFRLRVLDIDYEGLSDGISMLKINSFLKAKKAIFINGTKGDNLMVKNGLSKNSNIETYFPYSNERVHLDITSKYFEVEVPKEYMDSLNFYEMHMADKSYPITRIAETELRYKYDKKAKRFVLDLSRMVLPFQEKKPDDPKYEAIGGISLEKLREFFEQKGYDAKIINGTLVVANQVFMTKEGGNVKIQGVFSPQYIKIRDLFYQFTCALL